MTKLEPGWLKKQLDAAAERAKQMPNWLTRNQPEKTEMHVPYRWCSKDDCPCYLPECTEHGCMNR